MKKVLLMLAALFVAISLASCGGSASVVEVEGDSPAAIAAQLNAQLAPVEISGFTYMGSTIAPKQVEAIAPLLLSVQSQVPEGYVLKIYGHNDMYEKKSSVGYRRAKIVEYELRAYKMALKDGKGKMNVRAVNAYDKNMKEGKSVGGPAQRRVTFKVEKK